MRLISLAAAAIAAAFLALPACASAQNFTPPDLAAQRAAMERLSPLLGEWEGEASVAQPAPQTVHQTEHVERGLDGLLLLINGVGYATAEHTGDPVFSAFAVISYDERRQIYEVRSYTHEGYVTTATGEFLDDNVFRWSFAPGGPVRMRFTITMGDDSWQEVGEMSFDNGGVWNQMVSLDLHRAN